MAAQEEASKFISESAGEAKVGVLYHGDADGIAGAVICYKALGRLGAKSIEAVPLGRGLNPHSPETGLQLVNLNLTRLIVVDSGSRAGEILPGVPTLVIDHHRPFGEPQVEIFFNTSEERPPRPASLAMYDVCAGVSDIGDLDWVAAIGVVGDLGPRAPFRLVESSLKKYGRKNISDSVVLINAGRRHHDYEVGLAFNVLLAASEPSDIAKHRISGTQELERLRREVQDEL